MTQQYEYDALEHANSLIKHGGICRLLATHRSDICTYCFVNAEYDNCSCARARSVAEKFLKNYNSNYESIW